MVLKEDIKGEISRKLSTEGERHPGKVKIAAQDLKGEKQEANNP